MTKTAPAERDAAGELIALARRLENYPGFPEAVESLRAGHGATLDGVWGSSSALAAAALARLAGGPLVIVLPHASDADELTDDLRLFTDARQARFPAWNSEDAGAVARDEDWAERLRLLKALAEQNAPQIVLTTVQALLQPVVSQAGLLVGSRRLHVGEEIQPEELLQWLVEQGF
jgi:transcription-repair coupling factor (superfamily II helicase)